MLGMSGQQLHLILNHVPVIGALWALLLVLVALVKPTPALTRLALVFTLLVGVATVPAYLSGEPAEEVVEHLPGTGESALHDHEEMGEKALAAGIAAGVVALIALFWSARSRSRRGPLAATLLVLLVAAALLGWTGHLGGKVRRPELRSGNSAPAETLPAAEPDEEHEDH